MAIALLLSNSTLERVYIFIQVHKRCMKKWEYFWWIWIFFFHTWMAKSSELFAILLAKMTFPFSSTCDNGCYIIIANSGYENTNEIWIWWKPIAKMFFFHKFQGSETWRYQCRCWFTLCRTFGGVKIVRIACKNKR